MTTTTDLGEMLAICEARYALRQQDFAKLVAEENLLRAELSRLDEMSRSAETADYQTSTMRSIGDDIIWLGWLGRTKTKLNHDLARVLAMKERHLKDIRQAYGKVLVVKEMQSALRVDARKSAAHLALTEAIEMTVLK